jgi:phospholipid transport system substrate-binding protein
MPSKLLPTLLAGALGLALSGAAHAAGDPSPRPSPRPWIEAKVEAGRKLAERKVPPGGPEEERWRGEAKTLIDDILDWPELTRQSLGSRYDKLSAPEQAEFSGLLRELIEASYQSKLRLAARGEAKAPGKVSIEWQPEKLQGDSASIAARVKADRRVALLGFELRWTAGAWRVHDVSIDDVSTVRTYRSQFRKIADQKGHAGLVERMRTKLADIRAGRGDLGP